MKLNKCLYVFLFDILQKQQRTALGNIVLFNIFSRRCLNSNFKLNATVYVLRNHR